MRRPSRRARPIVLVVIAASSLITVATRFGPAHAQIIAPQVVSPPKVVTPTPTVTAPVVGPMPVNPIIPQLPFPYTCEMSFPAMAQPPACTPVLETVYVPGPPSRVASVGWDGSIDISLSQPASSFTIRARAPAPTQMIVLIKGQPLTMLTPNVQPTPAQALAGYYTAVTQPLPTPGPPTAWAFWQITVVLPTQLRGTSTPLTAPQYTLTLRDVSLGAFAGTLKQAPDLTIPINMPPNSARPSLVFLSGDNAKNNFWVQQSATGIVARDVTVAGWVWGTGELGPSDEDVHFSIVLDPDFIARNYAPDAAQLTSPALPGQPKNPFLVCVANCLTPLPFNATPPTPTVAAFLLAGNFPRESEFLTVETNAWHISKRGTPPFGYFYVGAAVPFALAPPAADAPWHADDAWAVHPFNGTQWPPGAPAHPIAVGDYLIVTGTLWQDNDHAGSSDATQDPNTCWDQYFRAQGGWLEIHPADVVRFTSPPPPLHKRIMQASGCTPTPNGIAHYYDLLKPWPLDSSNVDAPPNYLLAYQEIVDPRFTDPNPANMARRVELTCDPADGLQSQLLIDLQERNPTGPGYFNSIFTVWWQQGNGAVRAPCPRIMLPTLRISNQLPPTLTAAFVDQATKAPLSGVAVSILDYNWNQQASRTTGADGTVLLPFTPCLGGVAPPACRVMALRSDYWSPPNLWTPALAASNTMPSTNVVSVHVTDRTTGNPVPGAGATVVDSGGNAIAGATTAPDGTAQILIPSCRPFVPCPQPAGVYASVPGYLTCSMALATVLGDAQKCR